LLPPTVSRRSAHIILTYSSKGRPLCLVQGGRLAAPPPPLLPFVWVSQPTPAPNLSQQYAIRAQRQRLDADFAHLVICSPRSYTGRFSWHQQRNKKSLGVKFVFSSCTCNCARPHFNRIAMHSNNSCTIDVERVFGPSVSSACLGGFDFTLVFEETILTILPLSLTCKLPTNTRLATILANACLQSSYRLGAPFNCEMRSQKSTSLGFFRSNWYYFD
jgi:hypothetical protein